MNLNAHKKELAHILTKITDEQLMFDVLTDFFTEKEFDEMARRLAIVKKLNQGVTQREIAEELGVGIATITRGSKEMQNKHGGFHKMLLKFF